MNVLPDTARARQPKGSPTGGQYAAMDRAEADITLPGLTTPFAPPATRTATIPLSRARTIKTFFQQAASTFTTGPAQPPRTSWEETIHPGPGHSYTRAATLTYTPAILSDGTHTVTDATLTRSKARACDHCHATHGSRYQATYKTEYTLTDLDGHTRTVIDECLTGLTGIPHEHVLPLLDFDPGSPSHQRPDDTDIVYRTRDVLAAAWKTTQGGQQYVSAVGKFGANTPTSKRDTTQLLDQPDGTFPPLTADQYTQLERKAASLRGDYGATVRALLAREHVNRTEVGVLTSLLARS